MYRLVKHFNTISHMTHLDHDSLFEVVREEVNINGGRHENDLEIRTLLGETLENAQKEIGEHVSFVHFVDHYQIVLFQVGICLDLSEKHSLGNEEYFG